MNLPQKPGAFAAASPALVFIFCLVCLGLTGAVPSSQNSQPHSMCCVGAPAHRAAFVALAGNRFTIWIRWRISGYPPVCLLVLSTSWRIWDFFTVFSIYRYIYNRHQANVLVSTSINDITSRLPYSAAIIFHILVLQGPQCHSAKTLAKRRAF